MFRRPISGVEAHWAVGIEFLQTCWGRSTSSEATHASLSLHLNSHELFGPRVNWRRPYEVYTGDCKLEGGR